MAILNEIALITFLVGFFSYMILFVYQLRKKEPAKYNILQLIYENRVKNITEETEPIGGIQALRNFIKGTGSLVSGLLILIGVFVGFFSDFISNSETMFGLDFLNLGLVQFSLTICMLVFCLFNLILCLRYATPLSILIVGCLKSILLEIWRDLN
jgi:F0F1-type ATP synthase assembly protein I